MESEERKGAEDTMVADMMELERIFRSSPDQDRLDCGFSLQGAASGTVMLHSAKLRKIRSAKRASRFANADGQRVLVVSIGQLFGVSFKNGLYKKDKAC